MKKDVHAIAVRFMRDQVAIMKKHGSKTHIDAERYNAAVRDTQRAFEGMRSAVRRPKTK